jgi:hypothetical protein
MVSPERQAWVEEQVRAIRYPENPNLALNLKVKQLGPDRQQIRLESWGDGFIGLIYEAKPGAIVPLYTRIAGPADAMVILFIHLLLCGSVWLLAWIVIRAIQRHRLSS